MAATLPLTTYYLPFEEKLKQVEEQIRKLEELSVTNALDVREEVESLCAKREDCLRKIYEQLTPWDRIQVARHVQRPQTMDYVDRICSEFLELHGDRAFADDRAIVSGFATIDGVRVMLIGQHKGRDVYERSQCNFGMPQPEGYRKALWKFKLAEKYGLPVLFVIDTKGAAAAIEAEERGQSQAIAYNLMVLSGLKVPVVCVVIGEGGSGGALGIGVGDRFLMQEYAYFSVIAPEGCASILWRDASKFAEAAKAMRITAPEIKQLGIADEIIGEPLGGAHRDPDAAANMLKDAVARNFRELLQIPIDRLLEERYKKLRSIGAWLENGAKQGSAAGA